MCVAAAQDAIQARAYRDAAELLERATPFVADPVQRAEMQCQAADSYWNNNDSPTAKRLLEQAIPELEEAGRAAVAAHYRVLLGRCWWELLRTVRAREEFEKARAVLEPLGPSEALSVAYIRLSGLASFNEDPQQGLAFAIRAHEVAAGAGAAGAKAWSLNFMAISEMQLGRIDQGFAHLDESYRSAVAAQAGFPVGNAVYNAAWLCIHLARGRELAMWMDRLQSAFPTGTEPWLPYIRGLAALHRGQLVEALHHATASVQRSKDSGHQKMMWRSDVLRAFVLAECLRGEEAVAQMPPVSRRSDAQDMIYDAMPRVRCRLAVGDHAAADAEARAIPPLVCGIGSPADAAAEGSSDPSWLRSFMDSLPTQGEALAVPRMAAARGRLALAEGRFEDSRRELATAVTAFESGGFLLEAWHVGAALAEAEFGCGDPDAAKKRLEQIALMADASSAALAARIARQAATRLGFEIGEAPEVAAEPVPSTRITPGERMVSVLFADVRGYSRLSGQTPPAELADRMSTLQRWATQEVERRKGIVDKFAGDAVMATFNVSGQTVDHALQAVRTAVAIIDKAALVELPMGAGVAVGPAVVGRLADSANVSVLGSVTNLAARLQAEAGAGEVVMSDETHRRVGDWLEAGGYSAEKVTLHLKGFGQPVTAFRLEARAGIHA